MSSWFIFKFLFYSPSGFSRFLQESAFLVLEILIGFDDGYAHGAWSLFMHFCFYYPLVWHLPLGILISAGLCFISLDYCFLGDEVSSMWWIMFIIIIIIILGQLLFYKCPFFTSRYVALGLSLFLSLAFLSEIPFKRICQPTWITWIFFFCKFKIEWSYVW